MPGDEQTATPDPAPAALPALTRLLMVAESIDGHAAIASRAGQMEELEADAAVLREIHAELRAASAAPETATPEPAPDARVRAELAILRRVAGAATYFLDDRTDPDERDEYLEEMAAAVRRWGALVRCDPGDIASLVARWLVEDGYTIPGTATPDPTPEHDGAIETAEILADPDMMAAIAEGEAAAAAGDVVSLDEMRDVVAGLGVDAAATPPHAAAPETSPASVVLPALAGALADVAELVGLHRETDDPDLIVERVREQSRHLATLNGCAAAAPDVEAMEETIEILGDPDTMDAIREGQMTDAGPGIDLSALVPAAPVVGDPVAARDRIEEIAQRVDRAAGIQVTRWAADDVKQIAADLRALASPSTDKTHTEWGARWADGGYCPSNPARSEDFARQHARNFGTRPILRGVTPWVYADTGEPAFDELATPSTGTTPSPEG